jgi:hypothetical protein
MPRMRHFAIILTFLMVSATLVLILVRIKPFGKAFDVPPDGKIAAEAANSYTGAAEPAAERTSGNLPSLSLSFVGDLMAHPPNFRMSEYGRIYDAVESIFHADDLSFINLEFVVDPDRPMAGYPRFNVHRDYVEAAVDAGFDVFALANNHITDYGADGVRETERQIRRIQAFHPRDPLRPIYYSGVRSPDETGLEVTEIRHRGWKIGYLSVTGILNQWAGANLTYMVPYWDSAANDALRSFIRTESANYDLFILAYHGGTEYVLEPNPDKWRLFNSLMDAGVDILWGHHPHVLQPIEFYPREDGRYGALMHSLGNFVSSQPARLRPSDGGVRRAFTGDSAIVSLEVIMTPSGPDVRSIDAIPITHLREYQTDDPDRDGYEVHFTGDSPDLARDSWKPFYRRRVEDMLRLIGPASARYYQKTHPVP